MKSPGNLKQLFNRKAAIVLANCFAFALIGQQTYTFTNAGATGVNGPSQTQVTNAYSGTSLQGQVTATAGIQYWVVPNGVTNIRIQTFGAQGGATSNAGGFGACMRGDFTVTAGATLKIVVGQQGASSTYHPGGGGGTYVTLLNNTPLNIAGGGGGAYYSTYSGLSGNLAGTVSASGNAGTHGYNSAANGPGGTGGGGGSIGTIQSGAQGAGGGGLNGNGQNGSSSGPFGGLSFTNGSTGGASSSAGAGGFGGGGGGDQSNWYGSGGGGGYSGGGGGAYYGGGGGGGSFNSGSNQSNSSGCNSGHGKVIITELCSITMSINGVSSNSTICTGNTLTLTTNGVSNYSWSTGSTASSLVVTPTVTTVYSLSALSPSNCTSATVLTVTVNQAVPVLTVVNTAPGGGICPGKTVTLTATGATTYTWVGAQTVTNGVAFGPTQTSGYTVTGGNACGTTTAATSLSIHPVPTVGGAISQPTICSGQTFTLTATGNATGYAWSHNVQNGQSVTAGVSTIYTVTGTSALTCTNSATVSLVVVSTPILAPVLSTVSICYGGQASISASGASNYTWLPVGSFTGSNSAVIVVTPTSPTTYTLIKSNANCFDTKTVTLHVNQLPIVYAVTSDPTVCASKPATLTAGGGLTYTWFPAGGNQYTTVIAPAVTTIYTVAASDGSCISSNTVQVSTDPNPTLSIVATGSTICIGQSVTIGVSGALTYTWSDANQSGNSATVSPTISTLYTILGTNIYTCTSAVSQVIVVNPLPPVNATRTRTLVCAGFPSTLTATGAHTYSWTGGVSAPVTTVYPLTTTIYTVTGTYTTTFCKNTKTVEVAVFHPTFASSSNTAICFGGSILLTAGAANSYTWYGLPVGQPSVMPNVMVSPTVGTEYTVVANSSSPGSYVACLSAKTVSVGIYTNPTITAVAQRTLICRRETVVLTGGGGATYNWSHGASGTTVEVAPVAETKYTVTGTDQYNCVNTATVLVRVSICPGFAENQTGHIGLSVYPNPNNGTFVIKSDVAISLELQNELGQVIDRIILDAGNNYNADVKDLANGIYFISGVHEGQKVSQKILIGQ